MTFQQRMESQVRACSARAHSAPSVLSCAMLCSASSSRRRAKQQQPVKLLLALRSVQTRVTEHSSPGRSESTPMRQHIL